MLSMTMEARPPHGTKRRGDDSVVDDQRFVKRFNLLNIDPTSRLYIPANAEGVRQNDLSTNQHPPPPPSDNEHMQVDDSKHKVYIYDLDAELADEPEDDRRIFIPDIEKHLARIPRQLLKGGDLKSTATNQLVLYNIPQSLTVPQEVDNVRKVILEARRRFREEQARKQAEATSSDAGTSTQATSSDAGTSTQAASSDAGMSTQAEPNSDDPDAMEVD